MTAMANKFNHDELLVAELSNRFINVSPLIEEALSASLWSSTQSTYSEQQRRRLTVKSIPATVEHTMRHSLAGSSATFVSRRSRSHVDIPAERRHEQIQHSTYCHKTAPASHNHDVEEIEFLLVILNTKAAKTEEQSLCCSVVLPIISSTHLASAIRLPDSCITTYSLGR